MLIMIIASHNLSAIIITDNVMLIWETDRCTTILYLVMVGGSIDDHYHYINVRNSRKATADGKNQYSGKLVDKYGVCLWQNVHIFLHLMHHSSAVHRHIHHPPTFSKQQLLLTTLYKLDLRWDIIEWDTPEKAQNHVMLQKVYFGGVKEKWGEEPSQ